MKTFTFNWCDGSTKVAQGKDYKEALKNLGYKAQAMMALVVTWSVNN